MISRGVEISIARGGGEMLRVISLGWFYYLFLFYVYIRYSSLRYKNSHAALAMA